MVRELEVISGLRVIDLAGMSGPNSARGIQNNRTQSPSQNPKLY